MNTGKHNISDSAVSRERHAVRNDSRLREGAFDALSFTVDAGRLSRVLALMRAQNSRNSLPDKLSVSAAVLPFCVMPVLFFWAFWFVNATALAWTWCATALFAGMPALLLVVIRRRLGLASWLHRFRDPALSLGEDELTFSLRCVLPGRGRVYCWVLPYDGVNRIEYDRCTKSIRLYGHFDMEQSCLPTGDFMPSGMRKPPDEARNQKPWLELPLVFSRPEQFLEELERRTGLFITPAMRGDDLADLRDLPGMPKEHDRFRRLCVSLLVFTLATLLCIIGVRRYHAANHYRPYPATSADALATIGAVGDTVTLDGCDITLRELRRAAAHEDSVCYQLMLVFDNQNPNPLRMRVNEARRESSGNIAVKAILTDGSEVTLPFTGAPAGFDGVAEPCPELISSGQSVYTTLFFYRPAEAETVRLTINSDYWPPDDFLRDVFYTGGILTLDGRAVKSNEISFSLDKTSS